MSVVEKQKGPPKRPKQDRVTAAKDGPVERGKYTTESIESIDFSRFFVVREEVFVFEVRYVTDLSFGSAVSFSDVSGLATMSRRVSFVAT